MITELYLTSQILHFPSYTIQSNTINIWINQLELDSSVINQLESSVKPLSLCLVLSHERGVQQSLTGEKCLKDEFGEAEVWLQNIP